MAITNRYEKVKITKLESGKHKGIIRQHTKFYNKISESVDDIWVMTQEGDRLDLLANQFYGNPELWWYIARVNHLKTMNVEPGIKIRVPNSIRGGSLI